MQVPGRLEDLSMQISSLTLAFSSIKNHHFANPTHCADGSSWMQPLLQFHCCFLHWRKPTFLSQEVFLFTLLWPRVLQWPWYCYKSTVLYNSKASGKPKQKTRHPVTSAYIQFCVVAAHKQIHSCAVSRKSFSVNALMLLQELFSATSRPSAINKLRPRELTAAERKTEALISQQSS